MRKPKVDYWVWPDPSRPARWCYRSASIQSWDGTDFYIMETNCATREAAIAEAGRDLRAYGYGARLVPVPDL